MLVRAKVTHFHGQYRTEGDLFDHVGPLYENIEPADGDEVEQDGEASPAPKRKNGKAKAGDDLG